MNDYAAMQVAETCRQANLACPSDFSLVGVDNEEMHCECADPTLTSIVQDFRAATGKTILEEIQDVRFEKVCELLVTDVPIGHIASQCGMRSNSFLKRFFKARTGMTLREWRNAHRLT